MQLLNCVAKFLYVRLFRIPCNYLERTVTFHVESSANMYSFSVLIEVEGGDGEVASVVLAEASIRGLVWREMQHSWGAVWRLDVGCPLRALFSVKLRSVYSGKTFLAQNILKPSTSYKYYGFKVIYKCITMFRMFKCLVMAVM